MNNLITKTWKPLLSLLFGVAVMLFWAVPYMAGLCFLLWLHFSELC